MANENRNYVIAGAFVEALYQAGLRHVCICPGSRSTPLTISFDRVEGINTWRHLDERSAGFFALGIAKQLHEPVALVCSSGTAAANFLPAVVEAHFSQVPLLVLTADRPPELIDQGALQTIDQTRLYGSHIKWSLTMPTPEATPALVQHARATAARAFSTAQALPAGPVHLNFPFREPLEPKAVPEDFNDAGELPRTPVTVVTGEPVKPREAALTQLADELRGIEKGLIICGPGPGVPSPAAVAALARKLGYPVLADCLSGVRCGGHDRSMVIADYDAFVAAAPAALAPEVVLRFGAVPVSKPLVGFLEKYGDARQISIDGGTGWRDPNFTSREHWTADADLFCTGLAGHIKTKRNPGGWVRNWQATAETARTAVKEKIGGFDGIFEGRIFTELADLLPEGSILFAGNSMPVRDLDTFFPSTEKAVSFLANRGASGIDGVTSTALGVAAAAGQRVVLVLGDISFYHDLNGLLAARAFGLDATIIVLNNNGGGIFSFLPQAAYEDVFERCFGTPHGLTFKAAADLYCLDYVNAANPEAFREGVTESFKKAGTTVIEVPGDRQLNAARHRQVREAVAAALKESGE